CTIFQLHCISVFMDKFNNAGQIDYMRIMATKKQSRVQLFLQLADIPGYKDFLASCCINMAIASHPFNTDNGPFFDKKNSVLSRQLDTKGIFDCSLLGQAVYLAARLLYSNNKISRIYRLEQIINGFHFQRFQRML